MGFQGSQGRWEECSGRWSQARTQEGTRAAPRSALADCTRYSGRRRSNAHAKASSQWKVPLCVPIRGGAMRLLRGRLKGGTDSRLSLQCQTRRGGGGGSGGSRGRRPRRKWRPMQLSPRARWSADPENKARERPYFRLSAVPTATELEGRVHCKGRLSPGSPRGYDGTSEISTATGSRKGHTLSTTAHPLFTGPLLDARKDQHSAQLEHLLALNTSRPPNPTTVPGPLKKSPFALFLKQALRPWQPE